MLGLYKEFNICMLKLLKQELNRESLFIIVMVYKKRKINDLVNLADGKCHVTMIFVIIYCTM